MPDPSDERSSQPGGDAPLPALIRSPNFLYYLAARWFNNFAVQLTTTAVGWQIYEMTSDPLDLGLVGLTQFAPILALFLAAGLAADRLDRRAILVVCNLTHVGILGFLLYYSLAGHSEPLPIFLVLMIHGAARCFYQPSLSSILPNLVPAAQFSTAVAYASSASKLGHLGGPAAAGFLIAFIGEWVYLVPLVSFAIAVVAAALLVARRGTRPSRAIGLTELVGGFTYVWNKKVVLGTMSMDLVALLFSGIIGILPVFARDILHVGPEGLGVMRAMPAVGAVMVGILLTQRPLRRNAGRTLIISCVVLGAASSAVALSTSFALTLALLWVFGAADMVSTNIRQTLVQLVTPDLMRGRVSSVQGVTSHAANEIGDFRAGASAALFGVVPAVLAGGFITAAVSLVWWRIFPDLRRVDRMEDAR